MSIGLVYIHNLSEAIRLWAQQEKVGAVVVLSGGQDSTTCLFWAKHVGFKEVHAVTFDYGQRNSRELDAARVVAKMAQVDSHEVIEVGSLLKGASPLIDHSMQLELFDEVRDLPGAGIQNTFVPMRNQLFLTVAANRAYVHGARALITGVSSVDSGGYPDCTVPFIHSIEHTCNTGTFTGKDGAPPPLSILAPLIHLTKAEAVKLALEIPGCYEALAFSHTSYAGDYPPLAGDHATRLREKGFLEAMVPDPLFLRAYLEGSIQELPKTPNYQLPDIGKYLDRVRNALRWNKE